LERFEREAEKAAEVLKSDMGKFKFDAEGRKVLRSLSLKIQELDAHVCAFTESLLVKNSLPLRYSSLNDIRGQTEIAGKL